MAADYMKQILSAIAYCHERKIVHRDIKLENVLFESKSPNSSLKIIDFGTSRRYVPDEKLTRRIGTVKIIFYLFKFSLTTWLQKFS